MTVFGFSDLAFMGAVAPGGVALDPDAAAYIARVEGASGDNQALEQGVKDAINDFVVGCKADGIWNAIKASCILAGARTLNGALQPLVGTAPTSFNFVSGDYDRKTGLVGNGSTKYLNSNRNNNADPQNNKHISVYATNFASAPLAAYINVSSGVTQGRTHITSGSTPSSLIFRVNSATATSDISALSGFISAARDNSANFRYRVSGATSLVSANSETPVNESIGIFARSTGITPPVFGNCRLSFYSIGESLDLALLDARVTDLINAFAAAIP